MPKYIFVYHQPTGYVPGNDQDALSAWEEFFQRIADHVVDPGQPVFERTTRGQVASSTQLGGYSIVNADTLDQAMAIAKTCPTLTYGGGVQVGVLADLPPDHAAARLRERVATAER
jgi:hypothetical protein